MKSNEWAVVSILARPVWPPPVLAYKWLTAPARCFGEPLAEQPFFHKLEIVKEQERTGTGAIHLSCRERHPSKPSAYEFVHEVALLPSRRYAVSRYRKSLALREQGGRLATFVEESIAYSEDAQVIIPISYARDIRDTSTGSTKEKTEVKFQLAEPNTGCTQGSLYLSHYGLPEPGSATPTLPWYRRHSLAVAGGLALLVFVLLTLWRRRSRVSERVPE